MKPAERKTLKALKYFVLSIGVLFLLLIVLINLPFVHVMITNKANSWFKDNDLPISVGSISISLAGKLELNQINIIPERGDTIIYAGDLKASFQMLPLLSNKLIVENVSLENGVVNLIADSSGKLNLLSLFPSSTKDTTTKKSSGNSWDVQANHVLLQNIRFRYSDTSKGIELAQSLKYAEISFDKFSILDQVIDINTLTIQNAVGYVSVATSSPDTTTEDSPTQPWKFSAREIQLENVRYAYTDGVSQQMISVVLKKLNVGVEKLLLLEQELIVSRLSIEEPSVNFSPSKIAEISNDTIKPLTGFSISSPWLISCKEMEIKNGNFLMETSGDSTNSSIAELMPVQKFNTAIKDVIYGPNRASCNLNQLSCSLNDKVILHSGKLLVDADSLMRGNISLNLLASVSKQESNISKYDTIEFTTNISGSPELLSIGKLEVLVNSDARLSCSGSIAEVLNIPESKVALIIQTNTISKNQVNNLLSFFGQEVSLPEFSPFTLSGNVNNTIYEPKFDLKLNSASANLALAGSYNTKSSYCVLDAAFSDVKMASLFGGDLPETITGQLLWKGAVVDIYNLSGDGEVHIDNVVYKNIQSKDLNLEFVVANSKSQFTIIALDSTLACDLNGEFNWSKNSYNGQIEGLFAINEREAEWIPGNVAIKSGIKASFLYSPQTTDASLDLLDLNVRNGLTNVQHDSISLDLLMTKNSMSTQLQSAFLNAKFNCQDSLERFLSGLNKIGFENFLHLDTSDFINAANIAALPAFDLTMNAKYDSIFELFIPDTVFHFNKVDVDIHKLAVEQKVAFDLSIDNISYLNNKLYGVNMTLVADQKVLHGKLNIDSLNVDSVPTGNTQLNLDILPEKLTASVLISDTSSVPVYQLGIDVVKENNRILFKSTEPAWILNSYTWTLSSPEFLSWEITARDFVASTKLQHEQMSIELNGRSSDSLKVIMENVHISEILPKRILQNTPDGILNATIAYSNKDLHFVHFNFDVKEVEYKNVLVEHVVANGFFSMDSSGIMRSDLSAQLNDTSSLKLTILPGDSATHQVFEAKFNNIPVKLIEPFAQESINNLEGLASGEVRMAGSNTHPEIDGQIKLKAISVHVVPLHAGYTIPDGVIVVKSSQVSFNDFTVLDSLKKELNLNGTVNLSNTENITTDLRVNLNDFQVMNTTVKDNPDFFGDVIVNSGLHISGPISNPAVKGSIKLQDGTDITYRQVDDVSVQETQAYVTFASLSDSSRSAAPVLAVREFSGIPIVQTEIEIDPKSNFNFKISSTYDINISISGSGILDYAMLSNNTMSLSGSYEIKDGKADLKFPGWPIKLFKITRGSYLRWNGNVSDPEIDLEATSKVEGSYINPVDNKTRYVDFIVSMKMSNQLSKLDVLFDVKSEDQYIMSVLNALPEEERMRQAINLLIFQTINLPNVESSASSNYMNAQMNSFWENQLNSLTRTNLKKVELSFGIDTYTQTSATGAEEEKTSLSYEVERKFLNDRASVKVSGRINDGSEAGNTSNTMLENLILEYELDTMERKFLKLYTKKDYEDILDGEVTKSGAGFIYRKSYPDFKSIWKRKRNAATRNGQSISDLD